MILKIKDELKPDYVVACFDRKEATFRHEAYENYKAHRAKSDDELRTSGACHHCVLVPETSCEIFNKEVDRALIVSSSDRGIKGAFE